MTNSPKFRVLSPDQAKLRASEPPIPSPSAPTPTPTPSTPQNTTPSTKKAPSTPSSFFSSASSFSFTSFLRTRYASLPPPARRSLRVLRILAPIIPIGLFFSEHVLQVMWVRGPSMTPYLNEDYEQMHTKSDMVLVNMWPFGGSWLFPERKRRLERGMVVTFRSPANPRHVAIKRVVGLPGDRITTREPCPKATQIVPFNHVWLEGDAQDPRKSLDSNTYGPVSVSLITGRVIAVLWPRFRLLDWSEWEKGVVEGDTERRFGENYRQEVRERVLKEAVKLERPSFG